MSAKVFIRHESPCEPYVFHEINHSPFTSTLVLFIHQTCLSFIHHIILSPQQPIFFNLIITEPMLNNMLT